MSSRRPPPGKCIHCLQDPVLRTWDHLFPRSWYPATTPLNLEKWQVPACTTCNREYGKIENDLLLRFGMCLDPDKAGASGIPDKALRAMNPRFGKTPEDALARQRTRGKFLAGMRLASTVSRESFYPNSHNRWPVDKRAAAVVLPRKSLQRLTEKFCRGIFYLEDEAFIESPYEIVHYAVRDEAAEPVVNLLITHGKMYAREPGLTIYRAVAIDNPKEALFSIELWGQIKMYASVSAANAA